MDVSSFFSRLVQPAKPIQAVRRPDDLGDFVAAWEAIQETLQHPDERQIVRGIETTDVPRHLQHLVDALVYENSHSSEEETGPCFEYLIRTDLLSTLVKLSEPDRPHGIKGEVVRSINNLVVLLSDRFLNHNAVHGPLRRLLRSCLGDEELQVKQEGAARVFGAAGMDQRQGRLDEEAEADLVDLMCTLCSKMRAYPPLLLIFFHDKTPRDPSTTSSLLSRPLSPTPSARTSITRHSQRSGAGQRFEFLLFSYLLRFVHRDSRTGDFARAGLLFLFDIAFLPSDAPERPGEVDALQDAQKALAEYILDGDFAEVMAAAVGAVWSLLPSKLRVPTLADQAGMADAEDAGASGGKYLGSPTIDEAEMEIPCTTDEDVRVQLDLFLKVMAFLQDIITRCDPATDRAAADRRLDTIGEAITAVTLDTIHTSFFDNILSPSLVQCAANDGSAVAVLTYLHVLLSNIDDGRLLERLLAFLLNAQSRIDPSTPRNLRQNGRNSTEGSDGSMMKDLILANLSSLHPPSRTAALQLLQTMIQEHCRSTVAFLISVNPLGSPSAHHNPYPPEIQLYSTLLQCISPSSPPFDQSPSFAAYLADITSSIQADRCFRIDQLDATFVDDPNRQAEIAGLKRDSVPAHQLNLGDGIMREVMSGLAGWVGRTPDENVALGAVIISLTSCSRRSLEGCLTMDHTVGQDDWPDDGAAAVDPFALPPDDDVPLPPLELSPAIYQLLVGTTDQIAEIRHSVPSFDRLLAERRTALMFEDNIDEAINLALEVDSIGTIPALLSPGAVTPTPSAGGPTTPAKKGRIGLARSITDFFSPKRKLAEEGDGAGLASPAVTPAPAATPGAEASERAALQQAPPLTGKAQMISLAPISTDQLSGPWSATVNSEVISVSLDQVLDNIVVLEEFIKEVIAVIMARRALRIDPVRPPANIATP